MSENSNGNGAAHNGSASNGNGEGFGGITGKGWKPGQSGNPNGRPKKRLERDYFDVAKRAVTKRKWRRVVEKALETALSDTAHPLAVGKARDFLLKALELKKLVPDLAMPAESATLP